MADPEGVLRVQFNSPFSKPIIAESAICEVNWVKDLFSERDRGTIDFRFTDFFLKQERLEQ